MILQIIPYQIKDYTRDQGSIGLFLGMGFLVGNMVLSVLGLFLFCFCLVWGEQATDTQDFGWQSKGENHFRLWFPFFSCLFTWWQFCFVQMLSGLKTFLHISSVFFRSFIGNFLSFMFLLSLTLWLGIFFFCFLFLFASEGKVYGKLGVHWNLRW